MKKEDKLKEIIEKSNILERLKVFLLSNIKMFNKEQIDWLIKNLS